MKRSKEKQLAISNDAKLLADYASRGDIAGWNALMQARPAPDLQSLRIHNAVLKDICLVGANLTGAEIIGCDLENADFSQSVLSDANFLKSRLNGGSFVGATCLRTRFDRVPISGSCFVRACLREASFVGALARETDFSDADVSRANFQGADLRAAVFRSAILSEADLRLADFADACLENTNLENAKLGGAEMQRALLDGINSNGTGFSIDDLKMGRNGCVLNPNLNKGLQPVAEHCVKICLKLSEDLGSEMEIESIHDFSDTLEKTIEKHSAGEFDGDEFGGGECTLFMYGPDADRLFEVIRKPLEAFPLARGGYAIKRYGPPEDGVKEIKINL